MTASNPTRLILFSARQYDADTFAQANTSFGIELDFQEAHLDAETAILARGFTAVCPFVKDSVDEAVLERLHEGGTRVIALRSAGFNHVDLNAAKRLGMIVTLNRRLHRAVARTREGDFSLNGLLGFDLHGKTVGVIGTGIIGRVFGNIMAGFGMQLLCYDPGKPADDLLARGARYVELDELLANSDVVSLHCPLLPSTYHLINEHALNRMKRGAMLINTGRGGLVESRALIGALKSGQLGHLGLDVYEEEGGLFFEDHSDHLLQDDVLARLLMFPNVIVTAHQAFFTREALIEIATTTLGNVQAWVSGAPRNIVDA
ncbi:D-lactate dehydrogenase [Candidatus Burkholderia verschuerenii]|uniref:D-lactate dehydrogenase n=1 Tax=Candidatus Burkholderia verschuerenii TaxID=242163 RepID=A0A0L0M8L0_9BURK|nr:2-hydroxyacid dehydrogenase [Candidatus Burkholderia verschuerenii]KND58611.1 D-lactate dehydrogenase [Candidatus Burkholderia verschuerenii]